MYKKTWFILSLITIVALTLTIFKLLEDKRDHQVYPDIAPTKPVSDPLGDWIDKLAKHEACPPEGIIDVNGKRSFGPFCYQTQTFLWFMSYFRKHGVDLAPHAEDRELANLISDSNIQKRLTRLIFEDNLNNWIHWRLTVTKKIGYPPGI